MAEGIHLVGSFQGWDPAATATQKLKCDKLREGPQKQPTKKRQEKLFEDYFSKFSSFRGTLHISECSDISYVALKNVEVMLQLGS